MYRGVVAVLVIKLCLTLAIPWTIAHQAPLHGISKARIRQPTRLPHPWDSPGKNTGVGCHFLLQCMKVKSESEKWKWSRSVVSNPQRTHGLEPTRLLRPWDFPGKSTGVGCHCLLQFSISGILKNTQINCPFMKEVCACVQYRHKREGWDQKRRRCLNRVWKDKGISSKVTREGPFR